MKNSFVVHVDTSNVLFNSQQEFKDVQFETEKSTKYFCCKGMTK